MRVHRSRVFILILPWYCIVEIVLYINETFIFHIIIIYLMDMQHVSFEIEKKQKKKYIYFT